MQVTLPWKTAQIVLWKEMEMGRKLRLDESTEEDAQLAFTPSLLPNMFIKLRLAASTRQVFLLSPSHCRPSHWHQVPSRQWKLLTLATNSPFTSPSKIKPKEHRTQDSPAAPWPPGEVVLTTQLHMQDSSQYSTMHQAGTWSCLFCFYVVLVWSNMAKTMQCCRFTGPAASTHDPKRQLIQRGQQVLFPALTDKSAAQLILNTFILTVLGLNCTCRVA